MRTALGAPTDGALGISQTMSHLGNGSVSDNGAAVDQQILAGDVSGVIA